MLIDCNAFKIWLYYLRLLILVFFMRVLIVSVFVFALFGLFLRLLEWFLIIYCRFHGSNCGNDCTISVSNVVFFIMRVVISIIIMLLATFLIIFPAFYIVFISLFTVIYLLNLTLVNVIVRFVPEPFDGTDWLKICPFVILAFLLKVRKTLLSCHQQGRSIVLRSSFHTELKYQRIKV
jgi:hypothetical protein